MHRRSLLFTGLLLVLALPLSASQFIQVPFDQVATESKYIVRGTIDQTWSAWDDAHEVIFTYATVRVSRYFGEATGPDVLVVREVGGTVDGYTQEAIGFPAIRKGEDVVLMLSQWDDSSELRIHAFNQGKYLVKKGFDREILIEDPIKQGEGRLEKGDRNHPGTVMLDAVDEPTGIAMDEFEQMVDAARAGGRFVQKEKRQ
ncbi:MAG TPA: hypothetical protein VEO54_10940 [Thermoanaerobaculia bacterium]|nr:hypothetical protein [Thermoanaerobaculia bacterium]